MQKERIIRIFISSPGDVAEERDRARQVVESLRRRYADRFFLKPVLWEELPLQADTSFQQGIDLLLSKEHAIEIAIFILWSRLGSPLGPLIRKPDGSEYRSGTERELELMLEARKKSGDSRPALMVYVRQDEASFDERLRGQPTKEKENLIAQKKLAEQFIAEEFQDASRGYNVRAYHTFDRPVTLSLRLRVHLAELLDELAGGGMTESVWDIEKKGPPFLGLEAFQPQHADLFFGREAETLEARHALREQARNGCAFLLLSGASGSGKSSLARAGVLPAVVENELDEQVTAWRTLFATPAELGRDPLVGLMRRLSTQDVLPDLLGEATTADDLAEDMRRDPLSTTRRWINESVARAAKHQGGGVRVLLVLDQLEELFASLAVTDAARKQFLDAVEALARSGNVWVLATARSDFFPQVQAQPALSRMQEGHGLLSLLPPEADSLRRLIEEPARLAGLVFERREDRSLADLILRDATAHAELLPLLEYVLRKLFDHRTDLGLLTWDAYERLGGVEGALAKRAEEVFNGLPGEAQEALGNVLKALVTIGPDGQEGTGDQIVRQRVPLANLTNKAGALTLVQAFVAERLLTTTDDPVAGRGVVTLAHESLMRVWPRALAWAAQNRDFLRTRARLRIALKAWEDETARTDGKGRPDELLLPEGKPLEDARDISRSYSEDLTAEEHHFVRVSIEYHHKRRDLELSLERKRREQAERLRAEADRRRIIARRFAKVALVSAVAAILTGAFAWYQKQEAENRERDAKAMLFLNRADQVSNSTTDDTALALTRAADLEQPSFQTRSALIDRLVRASPYFKTVVAPGGGGVMALAWSGDSGGLAIGLRSGSVCVLEEGHTLATIVGPQANGKEPPGVLDLCFAEDRRSVAALFESGEYQICSLDTVSRPRTKIVEEPFLVRGAISPNGKRIAYAQTDPMLRMIKEAGDGKVIAGNPTNLDTKGDPNCFRFSSDSTRLMLGFSDGGATLNEGDKIIDFRKADGRAVLAAAWRPRGSELALSLGGRGLEIWDISPMPVKLAERPLTQNNITSLDWDAQGDKVALAVGRQVKLWRFAKKDLWQDAISEISFSASHQSIIKIVRWSPDGQWLASGDDDGVVKVWSLKQRGVARYLDAGSPLHGLRASPDGKWIAVGTEDGRVLLWNSASQLIEHEIKNGNKVVNCIAWQPGQEAFACGDADGAIHLYGPPWQKPYEDLTADHGEIWQLAWSSDGQALFFTGQDGTVNRWNPKNRASKVIHSTSGAALGLAVSPDGARLAMSATDGYITVQRVADSQIMAHYKVHADSIGCLAWSQDGRRIASAGNDGLVALSDPLTGTVIRLLRTPSTTSDAVYVETVSFSPDGSEIAAAGQDKCIHVWAADTGKALWQAAMHEKSIWHLQWVAPDLLLTSSSDGRVGCLDPREQSWLARAEELTCYLPNDLPEH